MENTSPLSLKDLPKEVREKIFNHVVYFEPGGQAPKLLIALGKESGMYEEAKHAMMKTNFVVTKDNLETFKDLKWVDRAKIRHLMIICDPVRGGMLYVPPHCVLNEIRS